MDWAIFEGAADDFRLDVSPPGEPWIVTEIATGETDVLTDVEFLSFTDGGVQLAGSIVGTAGNDILEGTPGDDTLIGLDGDDRLSGGAGANFMLAGGGDDLIEGGADFDLLAGGEGSDTLIGGGGNDLLRGGPGEDTAIYDGTAGQFQIGAPPPLGNEWTVTEIATGQTDLLFDVEIVAFSDITIRLDDIL